MKKQNLINVLASAALVVALAFGVQSCKKDDPCADVTCSGVGSCDGGTCDCDDGYEGGNCETEERTKFISGYTLSNFQLGNGTGSISISSLGVEYVRITWNNGCDADGDGTFESDLTAIATVNGTSLSFTNDDSGCGPVNYKFSGSGSLNTSATPAVMTLSYDVKLAGVTVITASGENWTKN